LEASQDRLDALEAEDADLKVKILQAEAKFDEIIQNLPQGTN
jgi:hypothetical protein